MRSIKHRFDALQEKQPNHSTYINFSMAVCGQHYNPVRLRKAFNDLVDKEDYAPEEKRTLLQWLYSHTNCAEAYRIRGEKSAHKREKNKEVSESVCG
jgi:hypothetical protein